MVPTEVGLHLEGPHQPAGAFLLPERRPGTPPIVGGYSPMVGDSDPNIWQKPVSSVKLLG